MTGPGFAVFETAIGVCGIGWTDRGVASTQLPQSSADAVRRRLGKRLPGAIEKEPPNAIAEAIGQIRSLLAGEQAILSGIELDLQGVEAFERKVYAVAQSIPTGETLTYGEIARRIGQPAAAQAVGRALGRNPIPIIIPCHRVLGADGSLGGFSAPGGQNTKARLLNLERARTSAAPSLFENLPIAVRPLRRP